MPTFDGGHCFLTILLPIDSADVVTVGELRHSHVQMVRTLLSTMPTALQSPERNRQQYNSLFARCGGTHFARLVVLNDVIYNGRMAVETLVEGDTIIPRPVDTLPTPYLLFTADFDAPHGTQADLRDWLREAWTQMHIDLDPVFEHCFEYAARVRDADSFADYMIAHQIETTMPFNDYWLPDIDLTKALPTLPLLLIGAVAVAVWAATGVGLWWLLGLLHLTAGGGAWRWLEIALVALIGLGAGVYTAYAMVMRAGLKPFPGAPNSDLPSILKGLHLQRQVIPLVAQLQGSTDQDVFDKMGAFLDEMQVDNLQAPTQAPGTIGT